MTIAVTELDLSVRAGWPDNASPERVLGADELDSFSGGKFASLTESLFDSELIAAAKK